MMLTTVFQCSSIRRKFPIPAGAVAVTLLIALFLTGCPPTIAPYSEPAYDQATTLKVEARTLMDQATTPFAQHQAAVEALTLKLDRAYEYARGIPNNEPTARQWAVLKDPNRDLLGGFMTRWRKESVLKKVFIEEKKKQVEDAFDKIIALESGKVKPSGGR